MKFPTEHLDLATEIITKMGTLQQLAGSPRVRAVLQMLQGYSSKELSQVSNALLYSCIVSKIDNRQPSEAVYHSYIILLTAIIEILQKRTVI